MLKEYPEYKETPAISLTQGNKGLYPEGERSRPEDQAGYQRLQL